MSQDRYHQASYTASGMTSQGDQEFRSLAQTIGTNIQKITQNVGSIQKMVNQLGTVQDSESLRSQLHQMQQNTNQLAKETNNRLKALANLSGSDLRQRKILREKLANDFSEALHCFQTVQRAEAEKEKESVKRARTASNRMFEDPARESSLIELASPQQQQQSFAQYSEEVDLNLLREREQAIRKLESDIVDVNTIFKDLAAMVHDQGDVIDSIEASVETAAISVDEGVEQLAKARQNQVKARKKMICLAVFGIVLLAIVITVIVLTKG
ncbi:syntaxin-12-like [Ornithodoros turicata]|uniref:syntaxin-12-like n=1 Tax=Ornithodoros turicata TaxID=34597 RepID=UPI0031395969